ncbi:hypothetical protein [Streptomyces virginiae]|uniref:hypothetical protein n=1 Tax=Streptomyces virginiae TaxID=1961 RepID=UPI00365685F2
MDIVEGSIAAIAAGLTGWAAWSAMRAAQASDRNSQTANRTAELAYRTAESVAQIERDRWHRELTPKVAFRVTKERGHLELLVRYSGPSSLGTLSSLTLRVRDDRDRSNDPVLAGGMTAEERANTIYGPFRFRPYTDGADETGRTVAPISLPPGEEHRLALDPSLPHRHYAGGTQQWEKDWREENFRMWVDCQVEGHKPWTLTADVSQRLGESSRWTTAE